MPESSNLNSDRMPDIPLIDPHGRAALLLVESLMHGLIERSVLTTENVVQITERAEEVQAEAAEAADGAGAPLWFSHGLLTAISRSLRHDIP